MFNLMNALNVEEDISNLRYQKVVLATDADVDGLHIRNLLITLFMTYFEGLIQQQHLYILETPLFKIRHKNQQFYFYTEEEKDIWFAQHGNKKSEVTRFKGLGEISPDEFKQFLGSDIRLVPVKIGALEDAHRKLAFFMGKNTPQRKAFIMNNLVKEDEMVTT